MECDGNDTIDGDDVVMGPWIWCFTSEDRVAEIKSDSVFNSFLQGGVAAFPATQLLQEVEANATSLVINPTLAFG